MRINKEDLWAFISQRERPAAEVKPAQKKSYYKIAEDETDFHGNGRCRPFRSGAEILCNFGTWKIFASDIINNE